MQVITSKSKVNPHLEACLATYHTKGLDQCVMELERRILSQKVRFLILEHCAVFFHKNLNSSDHLSFCGRVEDLKTIGGNVILGIVLQYRLSSDYLQSISKAVEYISKADAWYVCDIIGERVFGYSLLHEPHKTIPQIEQLSKSQTNWVVRSLGAGVHYAIKKGLPKYHVEAVFRILLTMANNKDKEIRQGIGWAAKTTAKFHPDIIESSKEEVNDTIHVANWFRRKIRIGLERNTYAQRNSR